MIPHIASLLIYFGVQEAEGAASHTGRRVADKVLRGCAMSGPVDLLFVHRDADSTLQTAAAGSRSRYEEINQGIVAAEYAGVSVPIVPVQTTETWLLTNESEIRRVAGNPSGANPLELPQVRQLEGVADPKAALQDALLKAASPRGTRRRKDFVSRFNRHRRQLLENLPVGGLLEQLPSWLRFRDDTFAALQMLRDNR